MVAKKDDVQDQAKANLEKFKKAQEGFKNSLVELKETHNWLLSEIEKLTDLKNSVEEQLSGAGAFDVEASSEVSETDEQKSEDEEPTEPVKTPSKSRRKPVKKNAAAMDETEKEPETDSEEEVESVAEVVEETPEDDENLDESLGLFDEIDEPKSDEKTKNDSNEDDLDFLDF